ncbi:sugar fermentation stimulation protein homolog [Agrobacterium rubi TR3 = NBRC 13261]|uniref:Sugar fermentation stimulation protein homolog n=1 Tax=Agrobacterium rubi TR3 = NBRC 13261 TaxID=1368415 RepID=A0A081CVS9_9HYPH|nr:DNA/RNA nuclease SfsA [Agrobacterium rubi]MBP1877738.1 sugar fermentation stimulation protein A [Agrobacterium rubi]MCL6652070.1 sugar fermentation stimulation protein SfsA [Agrobacterium rubi]GAK70775.1 sugar fermentation stimulation protein homolog [Agrobacterium rubi TR3 = NBRC 13261]
MIFDSPLIPGTLISRYKRFLFDAVLEDGTEITGSCPNTGSMRGLTTPGSRVWLSEHDSPTRKYRHMLEMVEADDTVVGINTGMPNRLAEEALLSGRIPSLAGYTTVRREQKYGINSRIDFLLSAPGRPDAYIEVKNVHFMREKGLAEFPDTATKRGAKHLEELGDAAESGCRAVMLYLIQRDDCDRLRICGDLDPVYFAAFHRAMTRGVEAYAIKCSVSSREIVANEMVAIDDWYPAAL